MLFKKLAFIMRVVNLTEWRWPNEYDQNLWLWRKTDNDEHSLCELHQNHNLYLPSRRTFSVEYDRKLKILFLSYSAWHVLCGVLFLIFDEFRSNSIVIGHVQQLHVLCCQFSVKFTQLTFLGFGHIQSCLSVIFIWSS